MVPLKLYLINKKISDIFEIEFNALAWIFVWVTTAFIITGTYLYHGNYLKEKYNEHFPKVQVEQVKEVEQVDVSSEETVRKDKKKDIKELILLMCMSIFALILFRVIKSVIYGE